jgi:hypothetical protein
LRQHKIFWSFFDVNGKEVMEQGANVTVCLKLRKTAKETYEIKFLKLVTEKNCTVRVFEWFKRFRVVCQDVEDGLKKYVSTQVKVFGFLQSLEI